MGCTTSEAAARVAAVLAETLYAELVYGEPSAATPGPPSTLGRIELDMDAVFTDNYDGTATNSAVIKWDAPESDLEEQVAIELWTAEFGGTRRFFDYLADPVTPLAGQDVVIPIGAFVWTEL